LLISQVDQLRKELHESKENYNMFLIEAKKNQIVFGGCPNISGPSSPAVGKIREMREYWVDDKFGENLPCLPPKTTTTLKSLSGRSSKTMTRNELLSRLWDENSRRTMNESLDSSSIMDNSCFLYNGFYRPYIMPFNIPSRFSKARPPKRKQPGQAPSTDSEDTEIKKRSSKFFVNMIESGKHTTTTFFFLGSEKKVVKTIKGVMMDVSPKLKELVQANDTVELPDLTLEGFEAMLQFIYSKEQSWSRENIVATMACASKFGLDDLYRACFEWLEINIQPEDAIKLLDECIRHGEVLGETAKHAVEKAAWDLIISDGNKGEGALGKIFESNDKEWIQNVLKGSSLVCSEEVMFDAVAHWACEQANKRFPSDKTVYPKDWRVNIDDEKSSPSKANNKKEVVKIMADIVPFIRFPAMSAEFITTNGLIAAVLQPREILEVLRYKHDANSCTIRFQPDPRYKTRLVSQDGVCAQSSDHFATFHYDPKLLKFDTGEGNFPVRISANRLGKVLGAELALTRCLFEGERIVEGPQGLDVAQTKLDYQPWWDLDLGRLCRIQKIVVLLGSPRKIPGRADKEDYADDNEMFPLVLCLGRDSFPDMEGTLTDSMHISVKTKTFERAPAGNPIELEWTPALVAARTFRIQCAGATSLRIMNVRIISAEPIISTLPCIIQPRFSSQ